jgi:MFS family permease
MLSLGLADMRGHVGISSDQGAWFDSAYNAAIMFIGPFSVYLGGLLGPRRVLLLAAGVFTVTCAFLPFIHSYSLLVAALIVAGLSSGTFYPLTLTFALRITPLRFLPFTMAFYATFIDGAVNVAPSLYGWYREHLFGTLSLGDIDHCAEHLNKLSSGTQNWMADAMNVFHCSIGLHDSELYVASYFREERPFTHQLHLIAVFWVYSL